MANLTAYPTNSAPKSSDLILGTKVANPNTDEQPVTMNFTVSDVASFANATAAYTTYVALISQTGAAAPTVDALLQNTTGSSFTWARTGAGTYTITASSALFLANKTVCFLNNGSAAAETLNIRWTRTSDTVITITTSADAKLVKGSFEIRIYS